MCVRLTVLLPRVSPDEGAKVVALDLLCVLARTARINSYGGATAVGSGRGIWKEHALLDEVPPALLALVALHPVLVELDSTFSYRTRSPRAPGGGNV